MRLIDADALEIRDVSPAYGMVVMGVTINDIDDAPTVDAIPVRPGKWIDTEKFKCPWFRHHIFECSVCRNTLDMDGVNAGRGDANYCPNCGAKMDAEREEE